VKQNASATEVSTIQNQLNVWKTAKLQMKQVTMAMA